MAASRQPAEDRRPVTATGESVRSWVLVVGMHRSGTSAIAGALGALGCMLPGPDDHLEGPGNPEHYESRALTLLDEDLLVGLGGGWDGPPLLAPHWPQSAAVLAGARAGEALRTAFPLDARLAWKDPRLCLLLPFWRRVLGGPVAAVLVWRSPLAVARSLGRRDGMHVADGLALWERYNRAALAGLRGLPTTAVEYDSVLADPSAFAETTADWLDTLDGFPPSPFPSDPAAAAALVRQGLRHERSDGDEEAAFLTPEQRALAALLRGLDGPHPAMEASAEGSESPWTGLLLEHRRRAAVLRRRLQWFVRQRDAARIRRFDDRHRRAQAEAELSAELHAAKEVVAHLEADLTLAREHLAACQDALDAVHGSTSWKVTAPIRWSAARVATLPRPQAPNADHRHDDDK